MTSSFFRPLARCTSGHASSAPVTPFSWRCLRALLLAPLLLLATHAAVAQDTATAAPPSIDALRAQLDALTQSLDKDPESAGNTGARDSAAGIQTQADAQASRLQPDLDSLDARLAELGGPPADASLESREVRAQRVALADERKALDARIRQARLLGVEAAQIVDRIAYLRTSEFQSALFARTAPPYSAAFWNALADSRKADLARAEAYGDDIQAAQAVVSAAPARKRVLGFAAVAVALLLLGRWGAEYYVRHRTTRSVPAGPLRRSALAAGITVVFSLTMWASARLLLEGLDWNDALSPRLRELASFAVGVATFASLVAALGRALLSSRSSSWRLPPLPDTVADALRFVPALLGLALFATATLEHLVEASRGSLALSVAVSCVVAVVLMGVLVVALVQAGRGQRAQPPSVEGEPARRQFKFNVVVTLGWMAVACCVLGLLTGYVALANFVAKQAVWAAIVLSLLYLLMHLADDLVSAALASGGRAGVGLHRRFGIEPRKLDQAGVLVSGALRLLLLVLALVVLVSPYAAGPDALLARMGGAAGGFAIGQLVLSPGTLVRALLVFFAASIVFRLLRRWFAARYLPTTRLEPGMQSSLSSLAGYAGTVLAIVMALAAIGVGVEKITWIASALSVGIGFGLQAVVQNFVSGLILLAERPVKVGDWVIVGDAEGDIRRINVRATEIRTGDRTTVLVPNSELITKVVRNRTQSNVEGLVKILLPMPLATDVDAARALILAVLTDNPDILAEPAPEVLLDDVNAGRVVFNASAFVSSPRKAYGTRSEVLLEILRRLRAAGMPLHDPAMVITGLGTGAAGGTGQDAGGRSETVGPVA